MIKKASRERSSTEKEEPDYQLKAKLNLEQTKMISVRVDRSYVKMLDELALADPERATVSTLVRRAIRQFLERAGKDV
jgi:hypothetical protein